MRFGLVGAGPWAYDVHGPGLVAAPDVELVGVWARDPAKSAALAGVLQTASFVDPDELFDQVDAVAFAVPPDVQADLAFRAANAGKHLLLDKPVATSSGVALELADLVASSGLASVVFFTHRFDAGPADWLAAAQATDGWRGGSVTWLADLDLPENPYGRSPWRRERGALWDIGPHAVSMMAGVLGPVAAAHAVGGAGDLVHLVLRHEGGATSTATLSLFAPATAATQEVRVWGEGGVSVMPAIADPVAAYVRATQALHAAVSGEPHPADVRFGARVVELLEEADRQLA